MSFHKKTANLNHFDEYNEFQDMESHASHVVSNQDREVLPEYSDPTDYSHCFNLNSSSNFNAKQGMKFLNKEKFSKNRFKPYNASSNSNNSAFNLQQSSFSRPGTSLEENQQGFTKIYGKENAKVKPIHDEYSLKDTAEQKKSQNMFKNKNNQLRPNFVMESTSDSSKSLRQKTILPANRHRHLIGSVEQVLRWHKSVKKSGFSFIYEANGVLECKRSQEKKQLLFIRGESGNILQAVFYEIDRPMPTCSVKTPIIVIGRMIGFRKMQVFDVTPLNQDDYQAIQRLSFLSQRSLNEALD